ASFHHSVWPVDCGRLTVCVGIFERRHIKTDGPAKWCPECVEAPSRDRERPLLRSSLAATSSWRVYTTDCRVGSRPGCPQARYVARLLSAKKRSFLARDHAPGLSPAGTFDAVLIVR